MKTYILRQPKTVEPSKARGVQPRPAPAPTAAPSVPTTRIRFIGLDVHNDSIVVSLAPSDSTEVRRYGIIGGTHDDVLKLLKKLRRAEGLPA